MAAIEINRGIIPLCIEGVRLSKRLIAKWHDFQEYAAIVTETRTSFYTQVILFSEECKHIEHCISTMPDYGDQGNSELPAEQHTALERLLSNLQQRMRLTTSVIENLDEDLSRYATFNDSGREASGSATVHVRNRLHASDMSSSYEESIRDLRSQVSDLKSLRKQFVRAASSRRDSEDSQERHSMSGRAPKRNKLPHSYTLQARQATRWLSSMQKWSRGIYSDSVYFADVLLLNGSLDGPCLDVLIRWDGIESNGMGSNAQYCVKADQHTIDRSASRPVSSAQATAHRQPDKEVRSAKDTMRQIWKFVSNQHPRPPSISKSQPEVQGPSAPPPGSQEKIQVDRLGQIRSGAQGVGPLSCDNGRLFMHPGHGPKGQRQATFHGKPQSFSSIFQTDVEYGLGQGQRLFLAYTLAKAALMYFGTEWWPQEWNSDQLKLYASEEGELADALTSLHISAKLAGPSKAGSSGGNGTHANLDRREAAHDKTKAIEPGLGDLLLVYGIRNYTLWGLGVALLQIGLWKAIDLSDPGQVRKAVREANDMGIKYRSVTEKLVHCDFGVGDDLGQPALQNAVYESVVRELEVELEEMRRSGVVVDFQENQA